MRHRKCGKKMHRFFYCLSNILPFFNPHLRICVFIEFPIPGERLNFAGSLPKDGCFCENSILIDFI